MKRKAPVALDGSGSKEPRPTEVRIPGMLDHFIEAAGTSWFVFKVDAQLDWRAVLTGARVKLGKSEPPELLRCPEQMRLRVVQDPFKQFLPLAPQASSGNAKLVTAGRARLAVEFCPASQELQGAERAVRAAAEAKAAAERRVAMGAASQRALADKQRQKNLKRFKVGSMLDALVRAGFPISAGDDLTDHPATAPEDGAGAEAAEAGGELLHLKPLTAEEVADHHLWPVAFWSGGPLREDLARTLMFDYMEGSRGVRSLQGGLAESDMQEFTGALVRQRAVGWRYLIGVKSPTSKRCFVHEAEMFHVTAKRREVPKDETDAQENQINYGERKGKLIEDLGTVKKLRIARLQAARKSREHKVADFGGYQEEMKARAEDLKSRHTPVEERDAEVKRRYLPEYTKEAQVPGEVYRNSVHDIAPPDLLKKESNTFLDGDLVEFLQRDAGAQLRALADAEAMPEKAREELWPCRTRFATALLATRARAGLRAKDGDAAVRLARLFGVANCLVALVQRGPLHRGGKSLPQGVGEICGIAPDAGLAIYWHAKFYDEILGKRKVRQFSGRKSLYALLIWSIQSLSPGLSLEFPPSVERELKVPAGQVKSALEFIGCQVTEDKKEAGGKRLHAKLEGPPKINFAHYDRQSKKSKDKGGK